MLWKNIYFLNQNIYLYIQVYDYHTIIVFI